jgi:uncharacterized membrane protein YdjX (TVP38/TMEM64 family)
MSLSKPPPEIEILPPDPDWQPSRQPPPVVYEVVPPPPGVVSDVFEAKAPDQPSVFETRSGKPGDPKVIAKLFKLSGRLALLVLGTAFLVWALDLLGPHSMQRIADWLRGEPLIGRVLVVVGVAASAPFFVPVGMLALIPGYLWGTFEGVGLTLAGATLGGLLNFAVSRRYLGPHVNQWAQGNPLARSILATVNRRGLRVLFALRMTPIMPYSLLTYLAGLTSVTWWGLAAAMAVGGLPWTTVYAVVGAVLGESGQQVDPGAVANSPLAMNMRWVGVAFTVALAIWLGRIARRELMDVRAGSGG